jgi:hypothetical protein
LELRSPFLRRPAWTVILLFLCFLSLLGWQVYTTMPSFFSVEMGSHKLFAWADHRVTIFLIWTSPGNQDNRCEPPVPGLRNDF